MKKLLLLLCIFTLPAMGQSANITGIPADATVYKITFKPGRGVQGQEVVHGALKARGEFLQGDYPKDDRLIPTNVTLVFDSPANPGETNVLKNNLQDVQPENATLRLERYTKEGFVVATDRNGTEILVPRATLDRAKRLEALQNAVAAAAQDREAPFEAMAAAGGNVETVGAGFLAQWGAHLLTIALTGLAIFGIARTCFAR